MDFFARQDRSRQSTRRLLVAFGLAFATVAVVTAIAVSFIAGFVRSDALLSTTPVFGPLDRRVTLLAGITLATMALMLLASLIRAASLSRGGGQVARMLGGTELSGQDADPLHRRLINVVEEMAIASGLPVPEIYVLKQEPGINAFAAGLTHSDAAIAVTQGALERLDRAQLQAVVAHEFSHILNGDMNLNQRLIGYSFGILVLTLAGRWLLRSSRFSRGSRDRGMAVAMMLGLALTVIGAIGVFFSRVIKAAVSRQRESLADASAVQFTREPMALAGALKKIGGYTARLQSVDGEEVAHMLFERGAASFRGLFATHPPLVERIRALDPSFEEGDYVPSSVAAETALDGEAVSRFSAPTGASLDVERVGRIESPELGAAIRSGLPEELYWAAHDRESSLLLVVAMAQASSPSSIASAQGRLVREQLGAVRGERCQRLRGELDRLDRRLWLPLLELGMPALKQRPAEQLDYLFDLIGKLVAVDGEMQLFEFVLVRVLDAYLRDRPGARRDRRRPAMQPAAASSTLLSVLSAFGHGRCEDAQAAYAAGISLLGADASVDSPSFDDLGSLRDLSQLGQALDVLASSPPQLKRKLLVAVRATIEHDRTVEIEEMELFRAIAASLHIPVPPGGAVASAA